MGTSFEERNYQSQLNLAEMYGYCESVGSKLVMRGSLVPYDHSTSPLSREDVDDLKAKGFEVGVIRQPEESGES